MFSSVRSTFSGLEAAAVTMHNPETGHEITIIGVVHLAHDSFWQSVQTTLNHASSVGVVHLEGVQPFYGPLAKVDQERVETLRNLALFSKKVSELTRLTYQRDGLDVKQLFNVKTVDADVLSIVRKLSDSSLADMKKAVATFDDLEDEESAGKVMLFILKNMGWVTAVQKIFKRFFNATSGLDSDAVILDYRNELAVEAAVQEKLPVTLLWGAAHIPGMQKLLKNAGYERMDSSWRVAIPRSYKI